MKEPSLAWVSTRRNQLALSGSLPGSLYKTFLLHEVLSSKTAPLEELAAHPLVAFELPPTTMAGFERSFCQLVKRLREKHVHILTVVLPGNQRNSSNRLWCTAWNSLKGAPFVLHRTCSC